LGCGRLARGREWGCGWLGWGWLDLGWLGWGWLGWGGFALGGLASPSVRFRFRSTLRGRDRCYRDRWYRDGWHGWRDDGRLYGGSQWRRRASRRRFRGRGS